jgi:hypothetical protein
MIREMPRPSGSMAPSQKAYLQAATVTALRDCLTRQMHHSSTQAAQPLQTFNMQAWGRAESCTAVVSFRGTFTPIFHSGLDTACRASLIR